MILEISYADKAYKYAQRLNRKSALKFGADKAITYGPEQISESFKQKNIEIWNQKRGGGYWIWKPYVIKDALNRVEDGDYVIYTDAGVAFVNDIHLLLHDMQRENMDIMVFSLPYLEGQYTKRDVFVLMGCDSPEMVRTPQRLATYLIFRKSDQTMEFIEEYLKYVQDGRIVTDEANVMGMPNYEGFVENRHDQSVLSLLSKKYNLVAFRDPSQYGLVDNDNLKEIYERSTYPQIVDSHRNRNITSSWIVYRYVPEYMRKKLEKIQLRNIKGWVKYLVKDTAVLKIFKGKNNLQ